MIIYIFNEACQIKKVIQLSSTCVQCWLEQLELLFLIIRVNFFRRCLSSSQLNYSIKFQSECLELQHLIVSVFGSRFL